jgi:predicted RNase H-like HicB family nuclease
MGEIKLKSRLSETERETLEIANDKKFLKNIKNIDYKGFTGTVEYSNDDECFYGKVLEIRDLIMYEGSSIEELEQDFKETIDEYIEDLKTLAMESIKRGLEDSKAGRIKEVNLEEL